MGTPESNGTLRKNGKDTLPDVVKLSIQMTRQNGSLVHIVGGCDKCRVTFTGMLSDVMDDIDAHIYLHALR